MSHGTAESHGASEPPGETETGPLSETLWQLFRALQHAGDPAATATTTTATGERVLRGEAGREQDVTRVRFALRVAGGHILEARYRAFGCPYTLAACEWLARQLQGRELAVPGAAGLAQAVGAVGGPLEWARTLQIPAARLGRLLVIEDALRAAFDPPVTKGA